MNNNHEITMLRNEIKALREELSTLRNELFPKPEPEKVETKVVELPKSISIDEQISNILFRLGVSANLRGYSYLREAIGLIYRDNHYDGGITKTIYPAVADKYNTIPTRVERAIRHAIETAWYRTKLSQLQEHLYDKPTNSEFIALVVEKLRFEIERESA